MLNIPSRLARSLRALPSQGHLLRASLALCIVLGLLLPAGLPPASAAVGVPSPQAPLDGGVTTVADSPPLGIPEFRWSPVEGATRYRIEVSSTIGFNTGTVAISHVTYDTRYTPTTSLPDGEWYWHVRVEAPTVGNYSFPPMRFTKQ